MRMAGQGARIGATEDHRASGRARSNDLTRVATGDATGIATGGENLTGV